MSAVHQYTSVSGLRSKTFQCVYDTWVRYPPEVCRMPFGLPVVPEVYRMNSGCSESNASGVCSVDCESTTSCHHTSRSASHGMSSPVRRTTSTFSTDLQP